MKTRTSLITILIFSLLTSAIGQKPSPAQQQQSKADDQDEVVRITTNLVQVDVTVTDKDGHPVTDLKPEQFEILQDGRQQTITNFSFISTVTAKPASAPEAVRAPTTAKNKAAIIPPARLNPQQVGRTMALAVDDLGLSFESLGPMRKALRKFVDEQMGANDLVAIVRTGADVGPAQQFTSDKRLLYAAIERLRYNSCSRVGITALSSIAPVPGGAGATASRACSDPQYSIPASLRALTAIVRGMRGLPGRKSMTVLSDSLSFGLVEPGDSGESEQPFVLQEMIGSKLGVSSGPGSPGGKGAESISFYERFRLVAEEAIRASVVIYGVDTRGIQTTGLTAADNLGLRPDSVIKMGARLQSILSTRANIIRSGRDGTAFLSEQTGGFLVRNTNDITGGVRRIVEDQKGYYLIGYRPQEETFDHRFHKIKARLKGRAGLTLRTRSGFYGVTEEEARPPVYNGADRLLLALMSPFSSGDINLRLTPIFDSTPDTGPVLRALLHIDADKLLFKEQPDGSQRADIAIQGVIFGDNGQVVADNKQSYALPLNAEQFRHVQHYGLDYIFEMPVKRPGAFQFRVGVYDLASARVGSAGQFIEVPDLKSDRLALSGLVVSGADPAIRPAAAAVNDNSSSNAKSIEAEATPSARRFRQSMSLDFSYAVFNARTDEHGGAPQLTQQTRIYRDGQLVMVGNDRPVRLSGQTNPARIEVGGRLPLGTELPPGDYLLQLIVTDALAKKDNKVATQWIDFEIVK
jgi:VWFA-related protein